MKEDIDKLLGLEGMEPWMQAGAYFGFGLILLSVIMHIAIITALLVQL